MSVEDASKFNNATVEIPDFKCSFNSATGRANKKSAGPAGPGSPEVAVVAQMRGTKDCDCVVHRECNHVVTTKIHPNPHSKYSFFHFVYFEVYH
jgi:hypothetical protein